MYIDPKSTLFGRNAKEIRDMFRQNVYEPTVMNDGFVARCLDIDFNEANKVLDEIIKSGLAKEGDYAKWYTKECRCIEIVDLYMLGKICNASCAKPVTRKTCQKALDEFLARVAVVNNDDNYFHAVTRVDIFGSFLTDTDKLSDLDLAINMERKPKYCENYPAHARRKVIEASETRRFNTYFEEIRWPETEVWLFLKNRSRVLSLHSFRDYKSIKAVGETCYTYDIGPVPDVVNY